MMKHPRASSYLFVLFIASAVFIAGALLTGSCKSKKKIAKERADSAAHAQAVADEMSSDADRMMDSINAAMRIAEFYELQRLDSIKKVDSIVMALKVLELETQRRADSARIADSIAATKKKPKGK